MYPVPESIDKLPDPRAEEEKKALFAELLEATTNDLLSNFNGEEQSVFLKVLQDKLSEHWKVKVDESSEELKRLAYNLKCFSKK